MNSTIHVLISNKKCNDIGLKLNKNASSYHIKSINRVIFN